MAPRRNKNTPPKHSSQIQTLKTSSGLGKVQSATQTFRVELGRDCHHRGSPSGSPLQLPGLRGMQRCVLSSPPQAVPSLPPGPPALLSSFPSPPPQPQSLPRESSALPLAGLHRFPALPNLPAHSLDAARDSGGGRNAGPRQGTERRSHGGQAALSLGLL